jgi:hypothetical protein
MHAVTLTLALASCLTVFSANIVNPVHVDLSVSGFNEVAGLTQDGFSADIVTETTLLVLHQAEGGGDGCKSWASYAEDMEISATEEAMVKVAHGDIANKATAGLAKHLDLDLDLANGNECVRAFFFKSGHSWQDTPVECEVTAGTDAFNACAFPAMSITVTFENKRGDPVTLFWENPDDGEAIQSGDPVAPGEFVSKNTFPTHTFLIRSVVAPSSASPG